MDPRLNPNVANKNGGLRRFLVIVVALFIAALAVDSIFGPNGWIATYRLKLQVRQEQQAIEQLKQQNDQLSNEVRSLKTDPSAIERIARERMGLVKPGELVFKLPAKTPSASNGSTQPAPSSSPASAAPPASPPHPLAHR